MPFPFLAVAIAVIAVALTAILLRPKPPRSEATKDIDNPVAEAGKPIPVVFGEITVKGLNFLWYGDKWHDTYKKKQDGGK